jgi:hypothetical protein
MEDNTMGNNREKKTYILPANKRQLMLWINEGDNTLLEYYKFKLKRPKTTVLHDFIGIAAKCSQDQTPAQIKALEE